MGMRQDRKNSYTGIGQICTELKIKKREYLPHFKRKKVAAIQLG